MWPFAKKPVPEKTPLRGLRFEGVKLEAPPEDAPPQRWLDWAALMGALVGNGLVEGAEEWVGHSFRAYRKKWGSDGKS